MKKTVKRLLSLFLAAILLLAPVSVLAESELGAEDNPYQVAVSGIDPRPTNIYLPAGASAWVQALNGSSHYYIGFATNANYKAEYKGTTYTPETSSADNELYVNIENANDMILVTNTSDTTDVVLYSYLFAGSYVARTGTIDDPQEVTLSETIYGSIEAIATADLEVGNEGYHFAAKAPADGAMTVIISAFDSEGNPLGWRYSVVNQTASIHGSIHQSDEEIPVFYEQVRVSQNDTVLVMVSTYDPESPNTAPEGTVSVQYKFTAVGTIDLPEEITLTPNIYGAVTATATKQLERGNTGYHFMTKATDDGILSAIITAFDNEEDHNPIGWTYYIFNKTQGIYGDTHWSNDEPPVFYEEWDVKAGDELVVMVSTYDPNNEFMPPEGVVSVQFNFSAVGSSNNPEIIDELGAYEATVEAATDGYYYSWEAAEDCAVTFSIDTQKSPDWRYSLLVISEDGSNDYYGDIHWSDDPTPVPSETITMNAGDVLTVCVNTYDPSSAVAPAGSVFWEISTEADILYGDADGNGRHTIADVLLVRKYIASIITDDTLNIDAADVDGNGRVTLADVLLVRKYIAGIITEFPAGK